MACENKYENRYEKRDDQKIVMERKRIFESRLDALSNIDFDILAYIGESYENRHGAVICVGDWRNEEISHMQIDVFYEYEGYEIYQYGENEEQEPDPFPMIFRIENYLAQYYKRSVELPELFAILRRCRELLAEEDEMHSHFTEGKKD